MGRCRGYYNSGGDKPQPRREKELDAVPPGLFVERLLRAFRASDSSSNAKALAVQAIEQNGNIP